MLKTSVPFCILCVASFVCFSDCALTVGNSGCLEAECLKVSNNDLVETLTTLTEKINAIEQRTTYLQYSRCADYYHASPSFDDGDYILFRESGTPFRATCDMTNGGYTRIALLDPNASCLDGTQGTTHSSASCAGASAGCTTIMNVTLPFETTSIRGYVKGYQYYSTDGFAQGTFMTIEDPYVDGVSVSVGIPGARQHVWTYTSGLSTNCEEIYQCPCHTGLTSVIPSFVGSDYYCETGFNGVGYSNTTPSDVLWDGLNCAGEEECCKNPSLPWFTRSITVPANTPVEVRICLNESINENVYVFEGALYAL